MSFTPYLKSGFDFYETTSAMQKSIRRGMTKDALYWATELARSGCDNYVWNRLMIITSEDVGLAEPDMPAFIQATRRNYDDSGKNPLFLVQAVSSLARAKKSRLVDWSAVYFYFGHEHITPPELPAYTDDPVDIFKSDALSSPFMDEAREYLAASGLGIEEKPLLVSKGKLTQKGYDPVDCARAARKAILVGDEPTALYLFCELDIAGYTDEIWALLRQLTAGCTDFHVPASMRALQDTYYLCKKEKKTHQHPFAHAVLLASRSIRSSAVDLALVSHWYGHFAANLLVIPPYALDKHTRRGKIKGATIEDFFTTGSIVSPHFPLEREDEYRNYAYHCCISTDPYNDDDGTIAPQTLVQSKMF